MQIIEIIAEHKIPVWVDDDGSKWYPLSTINREFYGRDKVNSKDRESVREYCKKVILEYENNVGISYPNETNVISEEGLKIWLGLRHAGRMSKEQKDSHNLLCNYFKLDCQIRSCENIIDRKGFVFDTDKYDKYTLDCIAKNKTSKLKLCTKCERYFPLHESFYTKNNISSNGFDSLCKDCVGTNFKHDDKTIQIILSSLGKEECLNYINATDKIEYTIKLDRYIMNLDSKELELRFVSDAIKNNKIDNFSIFTIKNYLNKRTILKNDSKYQLFNKVSDYLDYCQNNNLFNFDGHYRNQVWRFNGLNISDLKLSDDERINNISSYIKFNNIKIENIFKYSGYYNLFKNAKVFNEKYRSSHVLLIMKYYNNKYPAYMFSGGHIKYWKDKNNRINELKWLIEKDMKIENIDKIPIYLTKGYLNKERRSIYNILVKYYGGELFNWVNEVYPDKFKPEEFNIHYSREEFDSIEEQRVHEILKEKFGKSLFYNHGTAANRLTIDGNQPDWIVLYKKPIIIEYFGMYGTGQTTMIKYYVNKTHEKVSYYDKLEHYDKIYIYPEDLKNNYEGLNCILSKY